MCCVRPLFGCARWCCLSNNVLLKNLKALTICGHALSNEKGSNFFSSFSMMISIATLALGSQPKQGLAKVRAKSETWESHFMFPGMQESVRE